MLFLLGSVPAEDAAPTRPAPLRSLPGHFSQTQCGPLLAINAPLGRVRSARTRLKSANSFNMVRAFFCVAACTAEMRTPSQSCGYAWSRRLFHPIWHNLKRMTRGDLTPRGQRVVCACAQEREEGEFAFLGGE